MMRHPTPEPKQTTHRPQSREAPPDDAELYERGTATLLSSWEEYARATRDSAVRRLPGVAIAIFRQAPERGIYNAALLERGLSARGRAEAIAAMEGAYREAGVPRFAAWVHERDVPMYPDLMDRAYRVDEITRAMGMELSDIRVPQSHLNFEHAEWSEHQRVAERPPHLLTSIGSDAFQILAGSLGCESVSTGPSNL